MLAIIDHQTVMNMLNNPEIQQKLVGALSKLTSSGEGANLLQKLGGQEGIAKLVSGLKGGGGGQNFAGFISKKLGDSGAEKLFDMAHVKREGKRQKH